MNYIQALRAENAEMEGAILTMQGRVDEFLAHLCLPKFQPSEGDNDRRDWIATGDVNRWLRYIRDGHP